MRNTLLGLATIAMMAAAPAFAQGTDNSSAIQTQPAVVTAPSADSEKIVCRTLAPDTGSRIGGRRVCQTGAAWQQQAADARRQIEQQQARGGFYQGPTN